MEKTPKFKIYRAFTRGIMVGIIGQTLSDALLTLAFKQDNLFTTDKKILFIDSYYAAAFSGGVGAVLALYIDKFAVNVATVVTYAIVFDIADNLTIAEYQIDSKDIVFDIVITTILLYSFSSYAKDDYRYHMLKRKYNIDTPNHDFDLFDFILMIFIIGFYQGLKEEYKTKEKQKKDS